MKGSAGDSGTKFIWEEDVNTQRESALRSDPSCRSTLAWLDMNPPNGGGLTPNPIWESSSSSYQASL